MKKIYTFFRKMFLVAIAILLCCTGFNASAQATHTFTGTTWADLGIFIADADVVDGDTVAIQNNVTALNTSNPINLNKSIMITSSNPGVPVILTMPRATTRHFTVSDANVTFQNITLNGNNVGGGISITGTGNPAINIETGTTIQNCRAVNGGAINMGFGTLNITDGEIRSNTATTDGGGIYTSNGAVLNITGGKISSNTATRSGGGIYMSIWSNLNMTDGIISGNTASGTGAQDGGGGIHLRNFNSDISDNVIISGGKIQGNYANSMGGGIYVSQVFFTIKGTTVIGGDTPFPTGRTTGIDGDYGNKSGGNGGGIYHFGGNVSGSSASMTTISGNVIIKNNEAIGNGGGICAIWVNTTGNRCVGILGSDIIFSGNTAANSIAWMTNDNEWAAINEVYQARCSDFVATLTNTSEISGKTVGIDYDNLYNNYDIGLVAHSMIYNANFGDTPDIERTYDFPNYIRVLPNMFSNSGFYFWGWNTQSDGSGTFYLPKTVIMLNSNLTFYAIWETYEKPVYEIWNWEDLANINNLIDNQKNETGAADEKLGYYGKFVVMQNIGMPGDPSVGNGSDINETLKDKYLGDKRFGWYGYEGFIGANDTTSTYGSFDFELWNTQAADEYSSGNWTTHGFNSNTGWDEEKGWIPIGRYDGTVSQIPGGYQFTGEFFSRIENNENRTISGLWYDRQGPNLYPSVNDGTHGLFGFVADADIYDINISISTEEGKFANASYNGALAGYMFNCDITNVHISGGDVVGKNECGGAIGYAFNCNLNHVSSSVNVSGYGGLIGSFYMNNATSNIQYSIMNCYVTGNVEVPGYGGGFAGRIDASTRSYEDNPVIVKNCHVTGNVTSNTTNNWDVAGFAGIIHRVDMENCSTTGDLIFSGGGGGYIGGFGGEVCYINLKNCFATGDVIFSNGSYVQYIGGFAGCLGYHSNKFTAINCYAMGNVIVKNIQDMWFVGGFVGNLAEVTVDNCYSTGDVIVIANDESRELLGIGGFAGGHDYTHANIKNSYSAGTVSIIGGEALPLRADGRWPEVGAFWGSLCWNDNSNGRIVTFENCYYDETKNPDWSPIGLRRVGDGFTTGTIIGVDNVIGFSTAYMTGDEFPVKPYPDGLHNGTTTAFVYRENEEGIYKGKRDDGSPIKADYSFYPQLSVFAPTGGALENLYPPTTWSEENKWSIKSVIVEPRLLTISGTLKAVTGTPELTAAHFVGKTKVHTINGDSQTPVIVQPDGTYIIQNIPVGATVAITPPDIAGRITPAATLIAPLMQDSINHDFEYDIAASQPIILDITLFLQGVVQPGSTMTNHIQTAPAIIMPNLKLPVVNPYSLPDSCSSINNVAAIGGIVDWILVEIWGEFTASGMFTNYTLLEQRALLLKTDGSVVDTNGQKPQLMLNTNDSVRVVVKHRNHLSVVSNAIFPFDEDIIYDFSTNVGKALKPPLAIYDPMVVMHNGIACLWAGDLNMNDIMDHVDMSIFNVEWRAGILGEYLTSDVNMDGRINNVDNSFVARNTQLGLYSPIYFFIKRP